jgi:hypothetical protein
VRGDEIERAAAVDDEVEEVRDPPGRGRRWPADEQALVHVLDRAGRGLVEAEVLLLRARPEDLEVRLVPDLEAPPRDLVDAVAVDEVPGEAGVELRPAIPVVRRRDDPAVLEDRLVGLAGEVARHERDLDHGVEARLEQPVVDALELREVVDRLAVVLAVDAELVVQDRVGANALGAELGHRHAERLGEVLADRLPARLLVVEELRDMLGADEVPHQVEPAAVAVGSNHRGHRLRRLGPRSRFDRLRQLARRVLHRDDRRDRVPDGLAGLARRVAVRRPGDRQQVAPRMVDRLPGPVRAGRLVHEVAHRAGHRPPPHGDVAGALLDMDVAGRREGPPVGVGYDSRAPADAGLPVAPRASSHPR